MIDFFLNYIFYNFYIGEHLTLLERKPSASGIFNLAPMPLITLQQIQSNSSSATIYKGNDRLLCPGRNPSNVKVLLFRIQKT